MPTFKISYTFDAHDIDVANSVVKYAGGYSGLNGVTKKFSVLRGSRPRKKWSIYRDNKFWQVAPLGCKSWSKKAAMTIIKIHKDYDKHRNVKHIYTLVETV